MRLAIRAAQIGISFLVAACGGSGADEDESPTLSAEVATWTSDYAEAYCNSAWDCGCEGPSADLATCIDDVSEQVTAAAIAALADGLQFAAQCAAKQIAYYERDGTSLHCLGPATFTYANRHEPDMCNVFGGSATPGDSCAVGTSATSFRSR